MISDKMAKALNEQLNYELYSAYTYAHIAAHFEHISLDGASHWMRLQANEEVQHAIKIYNFILAVGAKVMLKEIAAPKADTSSPLKAFEGVYKHECDVTKHINKIADLAVKESDHATQIFLQWFISEQIEEEKTADNIVQKLRLVGGDSQGLFLVDRELAGRGPAAPNESGND